MRYDELDKAILKEHGTRRLQDIAADHHVSKSTAWRRARAVGIKWEGKYPPDYYKLPEGLRRNKIRKGRYYTDDTYRRKVIAQAVKWAKDNPAKHVLRTARFRAKKLGLPFDLTPDDIHIPERCPVFGSLLQRGNNAQKNDSPSLDRIEAGKGYVKGNVEVVSWRANTLKRDASIAELEQVIAWMRRQQGEKR